MTALNPVHPLRPETSKSLFTVWPMMILLIIFLLISGMASSQEGAFFMCPYVIPEIYVTQSVIFLFGFIYESNRTSPCSFTSDIRAKHQVQFDLTNSQSIATNSQTSLPLLLFSTLFFSVLNFAFFYYLLLSINFFQFEDIYTFSFCFFYGFIFFYYIFIFYSIFTYLVKPGLFCYFVRIFYDFFQLIFLFAFGFFLISSKILVFLIISSLMLKFYT